MPYLYWGFILRKGGRILILATFFFHCFFEIRDWHLVAYFIRKWVRCLGLGKRGGRLGGLILGVGDMFRWPGFVDVSERSGILGGFIGFWIGVMVQCLWSLWN